jgi:hypothetical protein
MASIGCQPGEAWIRLEALKNLSSSSLSLVPGKGYLIVSNFLLEVLWRFPSTVDIDLRLDF